MLPAKLVGILEFHGEVKLIVHMTYIWSASLDFNSELFSLPFKLGNTDCIQEFAVADIVTSLIVVPNYGLNATRDFIALLPKRLWSQYFQDIIQISEYDE